MEEGPVSRLRVLIVAEHASSKFGGEAALPLHYYRVLRARGVPVWLVVHERTRAELTSLFPQDSFRICFVPDTIWHRFLWRLSCFLPSRVADFTTGFAMSLITQLYQRRIVRDLVERHNISVIHQPIPVSPKEPSLIFGLGAPVVIGPMNGGMDYPPGFREMQGRLERIVLSSGRRLAVLMNKLLPGKREAAMLLVANERTRLALPAGVCDRVETLVENGVDLSIWKGHSGKPAATTDAITRFAFVGRLVDWKAVDLLLLAFNKARLKCDAPMSLTIIGDGVESTRLKQIASNLGMLAAEREECPGAVSFCGWLPQVECAARLRKTDVLLLPSLMECGGAVVLEAMAMAIPVIATDWGGPTDYLDSSCGILVKPESREAFIDGISAAICRLAASPQERVAMGEAGREKVRLCFDWEIKCDRIMATYANVVSGYSCSGKPSK